VGSSRSRRESSTRVPASFVDPRLELDASYRPVRFCHASLADPARQRVNGRSHLHFPPLGHRPRRTGERTCGKVSVRPATPKVMSFAVVPRTVSSAGGKVTISARVEHAHTCVVSSSPALVSMPMTFSCKSAMSHSMAIPANSSSIERVYSFHVSAAGPGGTTKDRR